MTMKTIRIFIPAYDERGLVDPYAISDCLRDYQSRLTPKSIAFAVKRLMDCGVVHLPMIDLDETPMAVVSKLTFTLVGKYE